KLGDAFRSWRFWQIGCAQQPISTSCDLFPFVDMEVPDAATRIPARLKRGLAAVHVPEGRCTRKLGLARRRTRGLAAGPGPTAPPAALHHHARMRLLPQDGS